MTRLLHRPLELHVIEDEGAWDFAPQEVGED